ncbi:hypothetical protein KIPB_008840 [Kipferlia bialata]|uniref:Uncharacterized protein n=1 Tax=Kipferlia bialata TaxID=797122 RepID=A0A391NNU2_9EUKA|nr:hypothetical protein KIPB_008840 [Kipferlia bialata]|eukprot:g8840.t1
MSWGGLYQRSNVFDNYLPWVGEPGESESESDTSVDELPHFTGHSHWLPDAPHVHSLSPTVHGVGQENGEIQVVPPSPKRRSPMPHREASVPVNALISVRAEVGGERSAEVEGGAEAEREVEGGAEAEREVEREVEVEGGVERGPEEADTPFPPSTENEPHCSSDTLAEKGGVLFDLDASLSAIKGEGDGVNLEGEAESEGEGECVTTSAPSPDALSGALEREKEKVRVLKAQLHTLQAKLVSEVQAREGVEAERDAAVGERDILLVERESVREEGERLALERASLMVEMDGLSVAMGEDATSLDVQTCSQEMETCTG